MPRVKDITHDLGKLRDKNILPTGVAPVMPQMYRLERKPAFNAPGFLFWVLIIVFLALQAIFLFWLAL
ncbi:MAG TPA: hypothetical protein VK995_00320 [Oceanipulchritudo sp.]|nr:hypothetical protein [Oceanipulchritudo sp.]